MEDNVNDLPNPDEFDEAVEYIRKRAYEAGRAHALGEPSSLEELLELTNRCRPVDEYQQQVLNAMKTQQTHILLMFGPGHGQTMTLNGPPADELVWMESTAPTFQAVTDPLDEIHRRREGMHRYRLNDELESAQMEECALYVHHERCCEKRFDRERATSHYERKPRDVFNKPHLRKRTHGPEDYPSIF